MPAKKVASHKAQDSSSPSLESNIWLEHAQAMQSYSNSMKDADDKVLRLYETINEEIKGYFKLANRLFSVALTAIVLLFVASIMFGFLASNANHFYQMISILSGVSFVLLLIILLIRNPLRQAHELLEKNIRINIAFLSFVRRMQQADLALRFAIMQTPGNEFSKILVQIQDFQNIVDQTSEEIGQIIQNL